MFTWQKILDESNHTYFLLENYLKEEDIDNRNFTDAILIQGSKKQAVQYAKRLFKTVSNCLTLIECDKNGENRKGLGIVFKRG